LNQDITPLLAEFDFDTSTVTARWVDGLHDRKVLQMRMDLGIYQMESEDRPDGKRPHGKASLLEHYTFLERTEAVSRLKLKTDDFTALQQEAVQYYYRYRAAFALAEYEMVIRDTEHNLDILAFVQRQSSDHETSWDFMQFKPYLWMMRARALAEKSVQDGDFEAAIKSVDLGLEQIREFIDQQEDFEMREDLQDDLLDDCYEIEMLTELRQRLQEKQPAAEGILRLKDSLRRAIQDEAYEKAAEIRDELKALDRQPALKRG